MRTIITFCLISISFAAPQYNYDPAQGSAPAGSGSVGFAVAPAASGSVGFAAAPAPVSQGVVHKQFYIHSAPEEAFDEGASSSQQSSSVSRNLRVVIVKAPENKGLENAALHLAKSASDQQTAIYVLTKQADLGDLSQKLSQIQGQHASKPEVHFVKYKTPEEAQYAQQSIQNQYNSLPGPTQVSDEGVAPVENYAGSSGTAGGVGGGVGGGQGFGGFAGNTAASTNFGSVSNAYLPAKRV